MIRKMAASRNATMPNMMILFWTMRLLMVPSTCQQQQRHKQAGRVQCSKLCAVQQVAAAPATRSSSHVQAAMYHSASHNLSGRTTTEACPALPWHMQPGVLTHLEPHLARLADVVISAVQRVARMRDGLTLPRKVLQYCHAQLLQAHK